MERIKFDDCRKVLQSGDVWNCQKKPLIIQCKQMFEDFEIETLEHQKEPYRGKAGDYIMIGADGEMYVCDKNVFEKTYNILDGWNISQYATNSEDAHFGLGFWNDSPFNDGALKLLRLKKIQKEINETRGDKPNTAYRYEY